MASSDSVRIESSILHVPGYDTVSIHFIPGTIHSRQGNPGTCSWNQVQVWYLVLSCCRYCTSFSSILQHCEYKYPILVHAHTCTGNLYSSTTVYAYSFFVCNPPIMRSSPLLGKRLNDLSNSGCQLKVECY